MKSAIILAVVLVATVSFAKGRIEGLRILEIKKGSIFEQLGLKNGDVVKTVNGLDPKSIASFTELLSHAKSGEMIDVLIQRGSEKITLHYSIK